MDEKKKALTQLPFKKSGWLLQNCWQLTKKTSPHFQATVFCAIDNAFSFLSGFFLHWPQKKPTSLDLWESKVDKNWQEYLIRPSKRLQMH